MIQDFHHLPLIRVSSRYEERKVPLHALTTLCGHSRETRESYYNDGKRRHAPNYMVWQYTIGGKGRIEKNSVGEDILPGTMMLLAVPGDEVYYLPKNSPFWEFVFLVMVGRSSFQTVKSVEVHRGNLIPADEIPKTMEIFQEFLFDLFSEKINSPFINSSRSYMLCMSLLEETVNRELTERIDSFEELLIMLRDNLYREISVVEMAGLMNLSRSHFSRLFTSNTGMSPREYLEDLRLRSAISILQNESITIKEVAARVGIRDENYFCRIFRKYYGLSPGKIRKRGYWQ